MIPDYTKEGIDSYVNDRIPTGDFLYAVLTNNLSEAFARADETNQRHMFDIVEYCWNKIPAACWGSKEKVAKWLSERKD